MAAATEHARALDWALAQAHAHRHEIPNNSNSGPFVELCQHATALAGTGWPWCVAFFLAAWRYGAKVKLFYQGASAYGFLDAARAAGRACKLEDAEPGDAVIVNVGSGHCAMLRAKYDGGAYVETVDGNWNNAVQLVSHPASIVAGCVRLAEPRKTKPAPVHVFEVATSAKGKSKRVYTGTRKAIARRLVGLLSKFPKITISPRR